MLKFYLYSWYKYFTNENIFKLQKFFPFLQSEDSQF